MTTNKEWLFSLPLEEQIAWMESEHSEPNPDCSAMLYKMYTENMKQEPCSDYEPKNDVDSRERLEADAFAYLQTAYITYPQIIELLDRQAAITAEETSNAWEEYRDATQREIAELTAERDNLKDDLIDERGELNRQINTMREVIRDYRNERDHYREKFGKCLDYADAIHALMDDEGVA